MRARLFLTISLLLLPQFPGSAQDAAAVPDFSDGFKKLAALGLPALDPTAKWVSSRDSRLPYELTRAAKSLKGNAWLLPAAAGKKAQLLQLGAVAPIEGKPSATSPDLPKDVAAIIAAINKSASSTSDNPSDALLGNRYSSSAIDADLLLFATQLYQTGHPNLANHLAAAIFSAVPSRETVVDAAIDKFASSLYELAAAAFFQSGDWSAYGKSLTDLTQRFPRGWSSCEAVGLFLPQVVNQADGRLKPSAPTLPDTTIDPRALAIVSELAEPPKPAAAKPTPASAQEAMMRRRMMEMGDYEYSGGNSGAHPLWLLDPPADPKPDAPSLERLAALKMAALPALAALLGDPFLTHSPNGSSYSSRSYYSSNESPEEILFSKYQSLHRPSTRGELAKQLLLATLPASDNSSDSPDDDTLRLQALEFWKTHQNATREELAAVFLREGSRNQISQAARILATATDPQSHQIFEGHVLGLDPVLGAYQEVQIYLRARKTAAKPFFDAYAKLVRSQTPADADRDEASYDETSYLVKNAGGLDKLLKNLGAMVDPLPPRSLAVQIAKGKPADAQEAIDGLRPLMADLSPTKQLHAYLEGANAATDAEVRARFLMAAIQIDWDEEKEDEDATPAADEDAPPPVREVSEPEAKVWRKLLADDRAKPDGLKDEDYWYRARRGVPMHLKTMAELAAIAFETSVSPESLYETFNAAPVLDKPVIDILKDNATARLAGKPEAPLPDAGKVSDERLAAIVAEAGRKQSAAIHPYLKTLTPDERAAWLAWLREPEDLPLPESVKAARSLVISKYPGDNRLPPPAKYTSSIEPGFMVTADNLLKHLESITPKIAEFSPHIIATDPAEFGPGLQVFEITVPLADAPAKPPGKAPDAAADTEGPADDSEVSDDDETPASDPLAQWRRTFKDLDAALKENPTAAAAVTIAGRGRRDADSSDLTLLLGPDGKFTVSRKPDAEESAASLHAALKEVILPDDSAVTYLRILTRAHAEILFKDAESEDSNLLPPP